MKKLVKKIEADDNTWVYNPPTRKERVELLKQTHNDNIEEMLQKYIKVSRKALKSKIYKKLHKGDSINSFGVYYDLRTAWESMARHRYPYIATCPDLGVVYLLLDESPSTTDSTIVRIRSGLGRYFYVDNGKDDDGKDTIMVIDIPSAVEAMKLFDKLYKQEIES